MSVIEVAIAPVGEGEFRVQVIRSAAGETPAIAVELDVDGLSAQREQIQEALLASTVSRRRALPPGERLIRTMGQQLFTALLGTGEIAARYKSTAAVAADRGQQLRMVLRIESPLLAGLPWETMHDPTPGGSGYICRNQTQLVRHVPVPTVPRPLAVEGCLRILGVISSPRGLPSLDTDREREQLEHALAGPIQDGLIDLQWTRGATWADLQAELLGRHWHVVHFIGHGDYFPDRDEGVLALTGPDGRVDMVGADRFTALLDQADPTPRLVVLNSCSGATVGATDLFSGTAVALVRGGITAVAAMQYEISDEAAIEFSRGFYTALAHGRSVDQALTSGRVAILATGEYTLEWLTPVLYLRGEQTNLFTLPHPPLATRPTQPNRPSRTTETAQQPPAASGPSRQTRVLGHTVSWWRSFLHFTSRGVAFSPDGRILASAIGEKTVRLWDPATGQTIRTLTGHTNWVTGVAFSPDGRILASSGSDTTVRLWDPATGQPIRTLTGHTDWVNGVAFSPDGRTLASTSDDKTVRLWDPATGRPIRTLTGHTDRVMGVAFSPDGRILASASVDKTVRLWDPATGQTIRTLTGHTRRLGSVVFSPDGRILASASDDKTVRLWE